MSQRRALSMAGIQRSSWHYRRHPRAGVVDPVPHKYRVQPTALTPDEVGQITGYLRQGWARGRSVFQSFHDALDAGSPVASLSSWYRCAARLNDPRPARPRRSRRAVAMPQWDADAPNQVWCWDITKLPGRYRGQWWCQYTVIDAFSRLVIANRVEARESDELAVEMFARAVAEQGCRPMIVHSDRGAAMTSKLLQDYYRHVGIMPSRNRPRVSNDNPFAETWFKTEKYRHDWPGHFDTLEQARVWSAAAVADYNQHHHHSGLAGFTPTQVHHDTWHSIHQQRQHTLDEHHAAHPDRYHGRKPQAPTPPTRTSLNPN